MEYIEEGCYKPILKNEVKIEKYNLQEMFSDNNVYVFGYGSLTTSTGWLGRHMCNPPRELIECTLNGFERGPFGVFQGLNFYGIIRNANKKCNGVLGRIHDLNDWVNLMFTECVAGIVKTVNYRVVDVTNEISDIDGRLEKPYTIHAVANRPINRDKCIIETIPAAGYYQQVWSQITLERTPTFATEFLQTGGFRNDDELMRAFMMGRVTRSHK